MKDFNKSAFVADVIKALEDAEKASQTPKAKDAVAKEAYSKLHYDFPLVTASELTSLAEAFQAQKSWALLSDRFLQVLSDSVLQSSANLTKETPEGDPNAASSSSSSTSPDAAAELDTLQAAFQKLYVISILTTLLRALTAPLDAVSALLGGLSCPEQPSGDAVGSNADSAAENAFLESLINDMSRPVEGSISITEVASEVEADVLCSNREDDEVYEPLDVIQPISNTPMPAITIIEISSSSMITLESKLIYLASKLSYHSVSSSAAWQDGSLLKAVEQTLAAVRKHKDFMQLLPVAGYICSLVHDRVYSSPLDLEAGLNVIVKGLELDQNDVNNTAAVVLGLGTAASLAVRLPQGPSKRKLWSQVKDLWLPVAATMLEMCEMQRAQRARRATKAGTSPPDSELQEAEERHSISIAACLIEFYVIESPLGIAAAQLKDLLVTCGALRSLALSCIHYGKDASMESLRRAILVCSAASSELLTWAQAVPGFAAVWKELIGAEQEDRHLVRCGAVYALLSDKTTGDALIARTLGPNNGEVFELEDFPMLYETLQLLDVVFKAAGKSSKSGKLSLWGSETDAALMAASAALRDLSGRFNKEDQTDEDKLGMGSEKHMAQMAMQKAKMLQPECLKLIKGLRAKPGSIGKSD